MSDSIAKISKNKKLYTSISNDIDQIIYDYESEIEEKMESSSENIEVESKNKPIKPRYSFEKKTSAKEEVITISKKEKPIIITLHKE